MAKSDAVWGIDVGQSALKALRCRLHHDGKRLVADAFDFIEYPKILSQPDADPAELVGDAIEQFLSRNDVKNDKVAISVSGQSGLARFIKLPPVESKKIPDIVKFEARQQIPFALEDVVWDFQQMAGGSEEEGYTLETEVGLFAMKRDQVFKALRPFTDADLEIDFVQLTPIALYNYIVFDQMQNLPAPDQFDPDHPPESIVVMSMGTDTTDLVVTNGYRVWQRSIPLGGSHFTKAITKEMKVTFTKAEQMKRTALKTDDAKAIFQAMRPVFNDLVTEVQRSISFFGSLNKTAKLGRIVALGNTMKLRGLQKFLAQNLGMEVVEPEKFRGLTGAAVVDAPAFEENHLAFSVCYGLCVQGVGKGSLGTNLLPEEIFQDRMVREKKPWAVAAVASLLVGCAIGYAGVWRAWASVQVDDPDYKDAIAKVSQMSGESSSAVETYTSAKAVLENVAGSGERIAGIAERRLLWAELMKALNECLPRDPQGKPPEDIGKRNQIHITRIDCELYPDLQTWFTDVSAKWTEQNPEEAKAAPAAPPAGDAVPAEGEATAVAAAEPAADAVPPAAEPAPAEGAVDPAVATDPSVATDPTAAGETAPATAGPTGAGFVIELTGHHFHNSDEDRGNRALVFLQRTFIEALKKHTVQLPVFDERGVPVPKTFTMQELGIGFPVVTMQSDLTPVTLGEDTGIPGLTKDGAPAQGTKQVTVKRFDFTIQFCWKQTLPGQRNAPPPAVQQPALAASGQADEEKTQ